MKQKISVLCAVRDDSVVKALMREMDDGEHCVFSIVKSGTQALCAAQNNMPDVLIADAILPGMDGPALMDRLRESLRAQTLCVIGGAMLPFAREAFERRGVRRIVGVPWDYAQLRSAILETFEEIDSQIDWSIVQEGRDRAAHLLCMLGMNSALRGLSIWHGQLRLPLCENPVFALSASESMRPSQRSTIPRRRTSSG